VGWAFLRACEALERRYRVAERGADWIGFVVRSAAGSTPFVVKLGSARGRPCIVLAAVVSSACDLSAGAALAYNAAAEHGALALEDSFVSLRLLVPVAADDLEETIAGMADDATRLRGRLAAARWAEGPNVGYVD
jgi:hypothetical protein